MSQEAFNVADATSATRDMTEQRGAASLPLKSDCQNQNAKRPHAALERLTRATYQRSPLMESPLQALVGRYAYEAPSLDHRLDKK